MSKKIEVVDNLGLRRFFDARENSYIRLMRCRPDEPLNIAADLNCYSMSLIMAYDLITEAIGILDVFTLDGRGKGLSRADGHEVLGVLLNDGYSFADGTIWQIFPNEEHIRIGGPYLGAEELIRSLTRDYKGEWRQKRIPGSFLTQKAYGEHQFLITSKKVRRTNI